MSEKRKKLSGAAFRKLSNEKRERETSLLKSVKKVDSYFSKKGQVNENSQHENESQNDELSVNPSKTTSSSDNDSSKVQTVNIVEISNTDNDEDNRSNVATEIKSNNNCEKDVQVGDLNGTGLVSDDPIEWVVNDATIEILLRRGIKQNKNCDFSTSKRKFGDKTRCLTESTFYRQLANGEIRSREYLVYSPSSGSVFCAPCKLFGSKYVAPTRSKLSTEGISDWKNIACILSAHENSQDHKNCELDLLTRKKTLGTITGQYDSYVEAETKYWRNVLSRVFAVVKKLTSRGRPLRGHDEKFGSLHNGEFMMSLELIAEFDPFLANHIERYGNPGPGQTSYLSSTICDEVVDLLASKVKKIIVNDIKSAKYFSVIVDSTPDISHTDQLSFVLRYVGKDGLPIERFIQFIPNSGHKAENLADTVLNTLESHSIDINDCRGQSYDNASNMSGIYSGLQARIKEINPKALFVPCAAHSLNLVGTCAASCCQEACTFFNLVQNVYNFFTASTKRWEKLMQCQVHKSKTVKGLSDTRWYAREDACRSLCENWESIIEALHFYQNDPCEKPLIRNEACGILNGMYRLETALMLEIWTDILERFGKVSETLQSVDTSIERANRLYDSLVGYMDSLRDMFDEYEKKAMARCEWCESDYDTSSKRFQKRKRRPDEEIGDEVILTGRDKFKVETFYVIIDRLKSELLKRKEAYSIVADRFSVFSDLSNTQPSAILENATKLQNLYDTDLESSFGSECVHFSKLIKCNNVKCTPLSMSKFLREEKLEDTFPNVDIALRMYLCTAVSNCSAERSFSTLKRIKSYLRSTLKEEKLNSLAILNIEAEILNGEDFGFEQLIEEFSVIKARRKRLM
jgi:hypothetical protein